MTTMLKKKDWSAHNRRALTATEIVANLAKIEGWSLSGDGAQVAIEKPTISPTTTKPFPS
jgi:4a-hydroxytetrahydrobiopterin dehydratase